MEPRACEEPKSVHRGASEGKMDGDSERHQVKKPRIRTFGDLEYYGIKVAYDGHAARSWEETQAWLALRSIPLFGCMDERLDESTSEIDITQGVMPGYSYVKLDECRKRHDMMIRNLRDSENYFYAKIALEFFEKSQDAEFEIVEVLYSECSLLAVPGANLEHTNWCHVSFVAKPKNVDCSDDSPKYFFGELLRDECSLEFNAKYCSTFEPSDDPGFNHGCVFCPADQKFHPGADGYGIGHPPWQKVKIFYA